jgi:hypothetical protein
LLFERRMRPIAFTLLAVSPLYAAVAHADEPPLPPPLPVAAPPSAPPTPPPSSSIHMTLDATKVDAPAAPAPAHTIDADRLLHGFRIGYGYVVNYDKPAAGLGGDSLKQRADLRAPSHLLLGYEVLYRVVSHSWLNVLLLANGMIAGLEQSKFLPSGNILIGAELKSSFQIGVGTNISPLKGSEAHAIVACGWTPRVGSIYVPFHVFFIPDVDGVHRMGVTTGVTF